MNFTSITYTQLRSALGPSRTNPGAADFYKTVKVKNLSNRDPQDPEPRISSKLRGRMSESPRISNLYLAFFWVCCDRTERSRSLRIRGRLRARRRTRGR